jgi:hypothetical protein
MGFGRGLALSLVCALGCGAAGNARDKGDDAGTRDAGQKRKLAVEIGTADPQTGLDFVPLMPGGDIPLETFGQGGTHASVIVRCIGFGNRAFIDVTVENIADGNTVMSVPSVRPQLLGCDAKDPQICDTQVMHVMTGGLADPDKKDGLAVRVTAVVHTSAGLMASGTQDGVLRKTF